MNLEVGAQIENELTGYQIQAEEARLEAAAATLLGQTIFEFGRLEVDLALYLVWSNEGRHLEVLTVKLAEDALHTKLCYLDQLAKSKYDGNPPALLAFQKWLDAAHEARLKRNEFIHGRWGMSPAKGEVVNVIGLPTSEKQREVRYSLSQLEDSLTALRSLRPQLSQLRKKWPL